MKKLMTRLVAILMVFVFVSGCNKGNVSELDGYKYVQELNVIDDKNRTYYQIFVYSFCDSNGDGIGDLNGVTQKLDYIEDMGFNGIWLMPIMPSPTYHKYDATDYCSIDADYGTIEDFKKLVDECHKRGIKLIIDFMINHSSSQHKWFQEACTYLSTLKKNEKPSVEDCPYIEYYHFLEEKDVVESTYYQVGSSKWYYEGKFWDQMPDLNLNSPVIRGEIEQAVKFWLDMGVDGFRIDGVKYFTESDQGNIEVLKWFNEYVKSEKEDAYLVAEVWTNYNQAVEYLQSGVDSVFNFSTGQSSGVYISTIRQSDVRGVGKSFAESMINIQNMTKEASDTAVAAEFLTNHDTGRCANFLAKAEKVKMAYALEIFMTGNVFVYYGEEIGVSGAGKDENFRAPMYWSATDTTGMTDGPADMDKKDYLFQPLDEQQKDPLSINNFVKRCIRIRNENPEIARGTVEVIPEVTDEAICAITKSYEDSKIAMLYNISPEAKTVTLSKDTYGYKGIRGYVSIDGTEVTLDGETVSLPPYSVVILK
ncbi:MAG: alpha amylase [Lachnospiraceae bacterium]|nr:alpha amylase [Lachnospiraceae bacterium]